MKNRFFITLLACFVIALLKSSSHFFPKTNFQLAFNLRDGFSFQIQKKTRLKTKTSSSLEPYTHFQPSTEPENMNLGSICIKVRLFPNESLNRIQICDILRGSNKPSFFKAPNIESFCQLKDQEGLEVYTLNPFDFNDTRELEDLSLEKTHELIETYFQNARISPYCISLATSGSSVSISGSSREDLLEREREACEPYLRKDNNHLKPDHLCHPLWTQSQVGLLKLDPDNNDGYSNRRWCRKKAIEKKNELAKNMPKEIVDLRSCDGKNIRVALLGTSITEPPHIELQDTSLNRIHIKKTYLEESQPIDRLPHWLYQLSLLYQIKFQFGHETRTASDIASSEEGLEELKKGWHVMGIAPQSSLDIYRTNTSVIYFDNEIISNVIQDVLIKNQEIRDRLKNLLSLSISPPYTWEEDLKPKLQNCLNSLNQFNRRSPDCEDKVKAVINYYKKTTRVISGSLASTSHEEIEEVLKQAREEGIALSFAGGNLLGEFAPNPFIRKYFNELQLLLYPKLYPAASLNTPYGIGAVGMDGFLWRGSYTGCYLLGVPGTGVITASPDSSGTEDLIVSSSGTSHATSIATGLYTIWYGYNFLFSGKEKEFYGYEQYLFLYLLKKFHATKPLNCELTEEEAESISSRSLEQTVSHNIIESDCTDGEESGQKDLMGHGTVRHFDKILTTEPQEWPSKEALMQWIKHEQNNCLKILEGSPLNRIPELKSL